MENFWHNVKQELPKEDICVLCRGEVIPGEGALFFGKIHRGNWIFLHNPSHATITHWAYIPKVC